MFIKHCARSFAAWDRLVSKEQYCVRLAEECLPYYTKCCLFKNVDTCMRAPNNTESSMQTLSFDILRIFRDSLHVRQYKMLELRIENYCIPCQLENNIWMISIDDSMTTFELWQVFSMHTEANLSSPQACKLGPYVVCIVFPWFYM